MKILQLSKFYPPVFGGVEQVAWDISEGLYEYYKLPADVLCVNDKNKTETEEHSYHITRAASLGTLYSTSMSFSFINEWRKVKDDYDIVHVHLPNPLAVLAIFIFRTKADIVLHWHSDIVKQKKLLKLFRPLQNWILRRAKKVIVTSPVYGEQSSCLSEYQHKIECIPIGIAADRLKYDPVLVERIKNQYAGKRIVFSLGRLIYYKGFEFLIEAARELPDDIIVLIGGKGELDHTLQALIEKNALQDKVYLLGGVPFSELGSYYQACDLFCLPSIHESEAFGVVQLEAMSFAKPIVSTNIPKSGVAWVNSDGVSGSIVPPADSHALAQGIIKVLNDKERLGASAKDRYEKEFTKEKMISHIFSLYQLLSRNS